MRIIILFLLLTNVLSLPCVPITAPGLVGAYSPQCNEDGSWKPLQCHGSIGYCWCVDNEGEKMREPFRPWLSTLALEDQCNDVYK